MVAVSTCIVSINSNRKRDKCVTFLEMRRSKDAARENSPKHLNLHSENHPIIAAFFLHPMVSLRSWFPPYTSVFRPHPGFSAKHGLQLPISRNADSAVISLPANWAQKRSWNRGMYSAGTPRRLQRHNYRA